MLYQEDWDKVKEIYKTWWDKELDYPLLQVTSLKKGVTEYKRYSGWEFLRYKCCPEKAINLFEEKCKDTYFGGESFPNLEILSGPLESYFTGYLRYDENTDTAWSEYPLPWEEVEKLEFKEDNECWQYTKYITKLSIERGKDRFIVAINDIGGILDVLSSLRGAQNLLIDLIDEPDRVLHMQDKIFSVWFKVYKELYNIIKDYQEGTSTWMSIWCHKRWYPLQEDFSYMISPKMFERFVAPYITNQCKWLDYSIYHLDGQGEIPHLDILLEIPELDGIQWVPGDGNLQCDSPKWFPMYRKILSHNKLLVLQSFDDKNNIPKILEELSNKGRILISVGFNTQQEAEDFIKVVRKIN